MILGLLKSLVPVEAKDAGAVDPDTEIAPGEEKVDVLSGDMLALFVLAETLRKKQYEPKHDESERLRKVYLDDKTPANRAAALNAFTEAEDIATRIRQLFDVLWAEVFETFPALKGHTAGIRKGFQLVRYKEKEKPQQPHGHALVICLPTSFGQPSDDDSPPDEEPPA